MYQKRKSGQVKSGQVKSGQVKSGQVKSGQVESGQVKSGQVKLRPVKSGQSNLYFEDTPEWSRILEIRIGRFSVEGLPVPVC